MQDQPRNRSKVHSLFQASSKGHQLPGSKAKSTRRIEACTEAKAVEDALGGELPWEFGSKGR